MTQFERWAICTLAGAATVVSVPRLIASPPALQAGSAGAEVTRALSKHTALPRLPGVSYSDRTDSGPGLKMTALDEKLVSLINLARLAPPNRREAGKPARLLEWDPRLAAAALAHSEDMARRHYLGHFGTFGDSPTRRLHEAGVQWRAMGENVARASTVTGAERAFMRESHLNHNHRSNILNPKFNYVGVGVVRGDDGMIYITQEFAQEIQAFQARGKEPNSRSTLAKHASQEGAF
jgi:uncharacterized protein YkwD